jgi:hypothetical protein
MYEFLSEANEDRNSKPVVLNLRKKKMNMKMELGI